MKYLSVLMILLCSSLLSAQGQLTVGQVFDFSVGDKFQYTRSIRPTATTPNASRVTVIDKKWSASKDTVWYSMVDSSYHTSIEGRLPEDMRLVYHFKVDTTTSYFTTLDSSIVWWALRRHQQAFVYRDIRRLGILFLRNDSTIPDTVKAAIDTTKHRLKSICNYEATGYFLVSNWDFEHSTESAYYGKGLGMLHQSSTAGEAQGSGPVKEVFYYKKVNGETCGEPDLASGIREKNGPERSIEIYPNPAVSEVLIHVPNTSLQPQIQVSTLDGRVVYNGNLSSDGKLDIRALPVGMYLLRVVEGNGIRTNVLIKRGQ